MKFRYFVVTGAALSEYLRLESEEFEQRQRVATVLFGEHGADIAAYRPGRTGRVMSLTFKPGRQPAGFVRASKKLSRDEVRPSERHPAAAYWRTLLDSLHVTTRVQDDFRRQYALPIMYIGVCPDSPTRLAAYNTTIGHVGAAVYMRVPIEDTEDGKPAQSTAWVIPDFREVQAWEYVKAWAERAQTPSTNGYDLPPEQA